MAKALPASSTNIIESISAEGARFGWLRPEVSKVGLTYEWYINMRFFSQPKSDGGG